MSSTIQPHARAWLLAASLLAALLTARPAVAQAASAPATPTPALHPIAAQFIDLARDHGLNRGASSTAADALRVRTLLLAALRFQPDATPAIALLHEMAAHSGDEPAARQWLERLVQADPGSMAALDSWLDLGPADANTLERQIEWLHACLAAQSDPRRKARVHARLARTAVQQLDRDQAGRQLAAALRLDPRCAPAILLRAEAAGDTDDPASDLEVLLPALELRPADEGLLWRCGRNLDACGLVADAGRMYAAAERLRAAGGGGERLAATMQLQLSANAAALGDFPRALDLGRSAARGESLPFDWAVYMVWLHERHGAAELSQRFRQKLESNTAAIEDTEAWGADVVAQAAWYLCILNPQPQRALEFAQSAVAREPQNPLGRRALGWALAELGLHDEARAELSSIAPSDAFAAYRLARLLTDEGDVGAPERLLAELRRKPLTGFAREFWEELLGPQGGSEGPWRSDQAADRIARFSWDSLDFALDPARFLRIEIAPRSASVRFGEPWWVDFELTNEASFSVLLGADALVNPVLLVSVRLEGDRVREFSNLMTVPLDRARSLAPGESVRVSLNLEIGPLWKASRLTPQQIQRVAVAALLDPVQGSDGAWRAGPGGKSARTAFFHRLPAGAQSSSWPAYEAAVGGPSAALRRRALESMAALLGESQRAALGALDYRTTSVPADRLRAGLLAALESGQAESRVDALDALHVAGLDAEMYAAAEKCVQHDHWVVRMAALRLLARRTEAIMPIAARLSASDPDELVRDFARSVVESVEPPSAAEMPASAPATMPSP